MNRIAGVMSTHFAGRWMLALGWLIMLPSFLLHLAIAVIVGYEQAFYVGGTAALYLTTFIMGVTSLIQTFPFALGLSASRRDYFLGTVGTYALVSAVSAVVLIILTVIEKQLDGWGEHLYFFNLPWLNDGTVLQQLFATFVVLELFYFSGFTIGAIYQRFGLRGL